MNFEEYQTLIQERDVKKLKCFLHSDCIKAKFKILVTALLDVLEQKPNLSVWDEFLSNAELTELAFVFHTRVSLRDFYEAYKLADRLKFSNSSPDNTTQSVQAAIKKYVRYNKINLVGIFNQVASAEEAVVSAQEVFGDLTVSQEDKRNFEGKVLHANLNLQKAYEAANKLRDSITSTFDTLFSLEPGTCHFEKEGFDLSSALQEAEETDNKFGLYPGSTAFFQEKNLLLALSFSSMYIREMRPSTLKGIATWLRRLGLDVSFERTPLFTQWSPKININSPLDIVLEKILGLTTLSQIEQHLKKAGINYTFFERAPSSLLPRISIESSLDEFVEKLQTRGKLPINIDPHTLRPSSPECDTPEERIQRFCFKRSS